MTLCLRRLRTFFTTSGIILCSNFSLPAQSLQSVQDLSYGVTLYHFYQQEYFDALTEILVGQAQNDFVHHSDDARLLQGGMSLSYGLDHQAEELFNELLEQVTNPQRRDRAWFYLGKLKYQRHDYLSAEAALAKTQIDSGDYSDQARYMRALMLLDNNQFDEATAMMEPVDPQAVWQPYFWFNLAVRYVAAGDTQAAIVQFRRFDDLNPDAEELKNLRDRAYTAAGFTQLSAGDFPQAISDFLRVRLESPLVDRAMLGYGWALSKKEGFISALSPWQTLSQRSLLEPAVQESYLAIPYAYEKLGASAAALDSYLTSADAFVRQIDSINQSIGWFQEQSLDGLFDIKRRGSDEWLVGGEVLPVSEQTATLTHLIARHSFQMAVKDLRDLNTLSRFLAQAQRRLDVLSLVDADQQQVWKQVVETAQVDAYRQREQQLTFALERLESVLASAEQSGDGSALAATDGLGLLQIINSAQARIEQLSLAGNDFSEEQEQLNRYRGLLVWQFSEQYPERRWQVSQQIVELKQLLEQTQASLARVEQFMQAKNISAFAGDIAQMRARTALQQRHVDDAIAAAEGNIRALAITELDAQKRRLTHYLAQARLAIARLYDRGTTGVGADQPEQSAAGPEAEEATP